MWPSCSGPNDVRKNNAAPEAAMDSYLVCYDISNPKRLRKVAHACEDFGYRVTVHGADRRSTCRCGPGSQILL